MYRRTFIKLIGSSGLGCIIPPLNIFNSIKDYRQQINNGWILFKDQLPSIGSYYIYSIIEPSQKNIIYKHFLYWGHRKKESSCFFGAIASIGYGSTLYTTGCWNGKYRGTEDSYLDTKKNKSYYAWKPMHKIGETEKNVVREDGEEILLFSSIYKNFRRVYVRYCYKPEQRLKGGYVNVIGLDSDNIEGLKPNYYTHWVSLKNIELRVS